ncbi:solute carrier family 2, facilitated glucose transporter member 3-like [Amphiura filiformis]|uniref:solute carrier family 2, facilitated glucose transporter member 3-like n=1 Tax=Amphiura filiformis TaxID=82378 RepID=UPI003B20C8E1
MAKTTGEGESAGKVEFKTTGKLDKNEQLKGSITPSLVFATISAIMGSLQFGYNTGVINNPQSVIQEFFNETNYKRSGSYMPEEKERFLWSTTVAIFAVGGMMGSFLAGPLADRLGRKGGLLLNNLLALVAGAFMGLSKIAGSYEMLIIGRLLVGINCGINTGIVPLYLSEISPFNLRGGIGVFNQLGVTIGILLSQILGLPIVLGTDDLWPLLLALTAAPAIIQIVTLPFCYESPRYLLIMKGKKHKAETALEWFRGNKDVENDIAEMTTEYEKEKSEEKVSIIGLITSKALRRPLVISIVLQLSQQFSGINAVLYYSTLLFISAGVPEDLAAYVTLSTGCVMVSMTIVSIPLMDKAGRRTLHLWGLGIMFIWSILLTVSLLIEEIWSPAAYISIVCVIFFTVGFALGPGSIPWLIVAELFSQGPRPAAISVAFFVNWTANFVVGLVFPSMLNGLQDFVFLVFVVLLGAFWLFTFKFLPETKNKSFDEISTLFRKDDPVTQYSSDKKTYSPLMGEERSDSS